MQVLLLKHVIKDKALPALVNVLWPSLLRVGHFLYATENPGLLLSKEAEDPGGEEGEGGEALLAGTAAAEGPWKVLDIKRSQHRSASSFLQWAAAQDILTLHEGSGGALSITAVNRTHSVFRAVRLANPDALKAWLEADAHAATGGAEGGGSGVAGANNSKLEIIIQDKVCMCCYAVHASQRRVMPNILTTPCSTSCPRTCER